MDVYELVEKFGGEIVNNKARVRRGKEYIIVGRIIGSRLEMTAEGEQLMNENAGDIVDELETELTGGTDEGAPATGKKK